MCKNMKIKRDDVYKAKQNHTDNILILDNDNKKSIILIIYQRSVMMAI